MSGEATWGTLRYLLVRPVSRARLVLAKLTVAYALTLIAILTIVGAGLVAGTIAFGWHDATAIQQTPFFPLPVSVPIGEALGRIFKRKLGPAINPESFRGQSPATELATSVFAMRCKRRRAVSSATLKCSSRLAPCRVISGGWA